LPRRRFAALPRPVC